LSADQLFERLAALAPAATVLVEESRSNSSDLARRWPIRQPASFYTFASGALGWGLPAAVGHALAEQTSGRARPVVAVIGDGSLHYSIQALWTAARASLRLIVIVPDNAEYAILKAFEVFEQTSGVPGLDIPGIDVVAIARGYGVQAESAATLDAVEAAFTTALGRSGPSLIRVPIARAVPPLM